MSRRRQPARGASRNVSLIRRLLRREGTVSFSTLDEHTAELEAPLFDWMLKWIGYDLSGLRVLDAGCWNAPFGAYLQRRGIGATYIGFDLSRDALASVRSIVQGLHLVQGDFSRQLPFRTGAFDTVMFLHTIEHVPPGTEGRALAALADVMSKDAELIIGTPLLSPLSLLDPAWVFGHRQYTPARLVRLAEAAGLKVVGHYYNGGLWQALDLLLFYVYKHVLRRRYRTPNAVRRGVVREFEWQPRWGASRLWIRCVASAPKMR